MSEIEKLIYQLILPDGICPGLSVAFGDGENYFQKQIGFDGSDKLLDNTTLFDLASVSKFFLAIIYLKLQERNIISISKSIDTYSEKYINIGNLSISDLLSYNVQLRTSKRIDMCDSFEEAVSILYEIEGSYSDIQVYSDMPSIVLAELLLDATGKTFGNWLQEIVIKPLNLNDTGWNYEFLSGKHCCSYGNEMWIINNQIVEKDNPIGLPNDPKARILSNEGKELSGNAGLFSSTNDIIKIAQALLNCKILSQESLLALAEGSGWEKAGEKQSFGYQCYRKYSDEKQTEVPLFLSNHAIAASGFTGCYLMLDPVNKIFAFIGGNRLNGCVSKCNSKVQEESGDIILNGMRYRSSVDYVYKRDCLRNCICDKAIQYVKGVRG